MLALHAFLFRFPLVAVHLPRILTLILGWAGTAPVWAQGPDGPPPPSSTWSLGVGAVSSLKPYTGSDRDTALLPLLQLENRYVRIAGPQIGLKLSSLGIGTEHLSINLVGRYDGSGYKASDAPILAGMAERKSSVWLGAEAEWKADWAQVKAAWLSDASDHSGGQQLSLGISKSWLVGAGVVVVPRVGLTWHDRKYANYYYGVRASEVRAGRSAYAGQSGANAELGVRGLYKLDEHHALFLDVAITRLAQGIKDSPLVDRATDNRVMLGYTYRFQ